jgi:hypothetical protein
MMRKLCPGCGRTKPLSDFAPRKSTGKAGGYRALRASRCRACVNVLAAIWRLGRPGYHAAKSRERRQSHSVAALRKFAERIDDT